MRKYIIYSFISLIISYQLLITTGNPLLAQVLRSDDARLKITDIQLRTTQQNPKKPTPSEEFTRRGYTIQTLPADKTVSRPFAFEPGSFLIRAEPGSTVPLPTTVSNLREAAVLEFSISPFTSDTAGSRVLIDCSRIEIASCGAKDWLTFNSKERQTFTVGEKQELNLILQIPENAKEGDYYLTLTATAYNKPYHYTSLPIYITITKSGIIWQNISIKGFDASRLFRPSSNISFTLTNGSPYYAVVNPLLKISSPVGFNKEVRLNPQVILANQSIKVNKLVDNSPLGPVKASLTASGQTVSLWIFALPF